MQNQTEQDWLENLEPNALGTGLFLLPDVHSDKSGATRGVFVPDITYIQCVQRGWRTISFKWIPHAVASIDQLKNSRCIYEDKPGSANGSESP